MKNKEATTTESPLSPTLPLVRSHTLSLSLSLHRPSSPLSFFPLLPCTTPITSSTSGGDEGPYLLIGAGPRPPPHLPFSPTTPSHPPPRVGIKANPWLMVLDSCFFFLFRSSHSSPFFSLSLSLSLSPIIYLVPRQSVLHLGWG